MKDWLRRLVSISADKEGASPSLACVGISPMKAVTLAKYDSIGPNHIVTVYIEYSNLVLPIIIFIADCFILKQDSFNNESISFFVSIKASCTVGNPWIAN
jgi:hypothetical protein